MNSDFDHVIPGGVTLIALGSAHASPEGRNPTDPVRGRMLRTAFTTHPNLFDPFRVDSFLDHSSGGVATATEFVPCWDDVLVLVCPVALASRLNSLLQGAFVEP